MNPTGKNGHRPWSEAELELLRKYYPTHGYRGVKVDRPASSIHCKARRLGLRPPCHWRKLRGNAFVEKIPRDNYSGRFAPKKQPEWEITPDEIQRRAMEIRIAKGDA